MRATRAALFVLMVAIIGPIAEPTAAAGGIVDEVAKEYLGRCSPVDAWVTYDPDENPPVHPHVHVRRECLP